MLRLLLLLLLLLQKHTAGADLLRAERRAKSLVHNTHG
jgi:hypothetical protein